MTSTKTGFSTYVVHHNSAACLVILPLLALMRALQRAFYICFCYTGAIESHAHEGYGHASVAQSSSSVPPASVRLAAHRSAAVLLGSTGAQMILRGLDTGQDGWIFSAGVLFFGVIGAAVGIVLHLLGEPR